MTMLLVVGVVDDLIDIEARIKLFFQVAAALLITLWGGLLVSDLGWLLGPMLPLELGWLALPFTVLCIVGLINAVNMFDGLDGLAGGSVAIALAWLALAGFLGGGEKWPILALLLCAAICAFLVFNARNPWRRRAASFLGDSGSMMLGVALAWFALEAGSGATAVLPPITVAWILALPVLDALILFGRRLVRRRSPFKADREHLHHTLTRAGLSHGQIVALLLSVGALWGGIGFAGAWFEVPEKWLATGLLAVALMHTLIHVRAWRFAAFLRRYSRRSGGR
nr:MraY family glycosyltransferase [Halorhodospira abdelmalekii]